MLITFIVKSDTTLAKLDVRGVGERQIPTMRKINMTNSWNLG